MSAMQSWAFVLLLAALGARGLDRVRLLEKDLAVIGLAAAVAIAQRICIDQVTVDDPLFAPVLLALPTAAALRGGARAGLAAAVGTWLALTVVAAAVPVPLQGDLPQEGFVVALVFAALTAGAAAALPPHRRFAGPWLGLAWAGFFIVRDRTLILSASVNAVLLLTVAWTYVGAFFVRARSAEA